MIKYLNDVRVESERRFDCLRQGLTAAEGLISGKACVYATGSFGRFEAGPDSDLDLFIVVDISRDKNLQNRPKLSGIDEIKLKYFLIKAVEDGGISKFDGGGKYLGSHSIDDFSAHLGSRDDDYKNTLTGRLLLLLESRPLIGGDVYSKLLESVIDAYFHDYDGNEENFMPSFLVNDILRLWRTFCVNYEFSRKHGAVDTKIKNLKLKFSRMLTCYSAIIYMLSIYVLRGTVSPQDIKCMVAMTPTQRLEYTLGLDCFGGHSDKILFRSAINTALIEYSNFLELTHKPKKQLLSDFEENIDDWRRSSYEFGSQLSVSLSLLGSLRSGERNLFRIILI